MITTQSLNIEDNIGKVGSNIKQSYGRNFDYLALNTESTILSKKEVRQAINYAIDKQEIINSVYGGKYIAADNPLEYGSYLYSKDNEKYQHNVERAKQILKETGWIFSGNVWQKKEENSTLKISINLVVQESNENRIKVSEIIKKNIEEIGIPVNIIKANDKTYENYQQNKNYDIILARNNSTA